MIVLFVSSRKIEHEATRVVAAQDGKHEKKRRGEKGRKLRKLEEIERRRAQTKFGGEYSPRRTVGSPIACETPALEIQKLMEFCLVIYNIILFCFFVYFCDVFDEFDVLVAFVLIV